MNPEIEKLIDLALSDGKITDKERSVILKKAEKLGEDPDEVEMILDGRLSESKKLKTKEKVGNIKVCPSCGESVKSFQLNCSGCGHEFRNNNSSITSLLSELQEIDKKVFKTGYETGRYQSLHETILKQIRDKKKVDFISNFSIPVSKENLYEFITFSKSKIDYDIVEDILTKEWRKKYSEALGKAIISFPKGSSEYNEVLQLQRDLSVSNKKQKKKETWVVVLSILFIFLSVFGILIFGKNLLN
ncbi:zinc ribbon domain-containing protein [Flavobacteriaceae bacterium]|nr:zinc ribbon domain-containing protein [Flavobacteriaceae bacterium]